MDRRMIVAFLLGALVYYLYLSKLKGVINGNPLMPTPAGKRAG